MSTRIDMIGLFAKDLPRMVAFYRDLLGFQIDWDGSSPYAEFENEGVRFSMYQRDLLPELLGKQVSSPQGLNASFELAIDFPLFEDVDREYARLVSAGAQPVLAPRTEPWGMRSSYVADPDGNLIEIGSWGKGAKTQASN